MEADTLQSICGRCGGRGTVPHPMGDSHEDRCTCENCGGSGKEPPPVVAVAPRRPAGMLASAAQAFADICAEIEENDALPKPRPLTDLVKARFAFLHGQLSQNVDLAIGFKNACDDFIAGCEQREKALRASRKKIEEVLSCHKAECKAALEAHPDQPYRGKYGGIKLQKNGGKPALRLRFVEEEKTLRHVIDPQAVELFEIPDEYVETVIVTRLNTDAVRQALGEGKVLPWASLERDSHVKFGS